MTGSATSAVLEAQFRALVDALPDAVVVHIDGLVVFVNPTALRLLGYARSEDLVGQPISTIVVPEDLPRIRERIGRLVATGEPAGPQDERLVRRDGTTVLVRVRAIPVTWDGALAVLAFGQDLTELRAYEDRLAMADRLASVGTLAAGMAHDLNNPLAHLMLTLDLALHATRASDPMEAGTAVTVARRIEEALTAVERLRAIVDDLRVFARPPGDVLGPVHLDAPLQAAAGLAGVELRHRCRFELGLGETPVVNASEGRLVQVFLNLVVNALQALPPDRPAEDNHIRVWCGTGPRGCAQVIVEDNGVGIPPEHLLRVFEPYFTTKPPGVGTGLGLWMVHGVVQRLGGEVRIASTPGQGTRVTVDLPAALSS